MASLLLRLFHSDYFSPHLALSYLRTYSDNIGITYYLVSQLESAFPSQEVEFYWPQLCHLLTTKPSESRALECFILRRCQESVHVALLTLWYFQASLFDLSSNPHTASFQVCQRIFNRCQQILFEDPLATSKPAYAARGSSSTEKISPLNPLAGIVGMGSVLASVPGMPKLASISGIIAIEQGRKKPDSMDSVFASRASAEGDEDLAAMEEEEDDEEQQEPAQEEQHTAETSTGTMEVGETSVDSQLSSRTIPARMARAGTLPPSLDNRNGSNSQVQVAPGIAPNSGGAVPSTDKGKKVDNPFASFAAGFNGFRDKAAAAVGDVFGQVTGQEPSLAFRKATAAPPSWHPQRQRSSAAFVQKAANSKSVPNLIAARGSVSAFSSSAALPSDSVAQMEAVLSLYNSDARRRLLRSNYCRVQTQFLLSLQDISARLLPLPKPARLSALRAELTALNHKLPAEICFPLWCSADDKDGGDSKDAKAPKRHHRIIRINPSEAVVLNSADRVPFLLHVEVLINDLDFDPDRRQNRETLKKLVTEEDVKRRKTWLLSGQEPTTAVDQLLAREGETLTPRSDSPELRVGTTKQVFNDLTPAVEKAETPRTSSPAIPALPLAPPPEDEEEVDLTEQAYGSDLAAFGEEREDDSDDEQASDLTERNRAHDTKAWTYAREQQLQGEARRKSFSLDEYSNRMRTAAIMLSQLNKSTNASATPMVNYGPNVSTNAQGGWSSWIVPTNWYGASGGGAGDKSEIGQGTAGVSTHLNGAKAEAPRSSGSGMDRPVGGGGGSRLVHAETEAIRKRIMQEMMALEEERMQRMKAGGRNLTRSKKSKTTGPEDEAAVLRAVNKDDPSAAMFSESWAAKKARIRASSPYGHLASWDVFSVIVKTGADLRQEQLAVQLINEFGRIWNETGSRCWVRYFRILVTSESSGLMETITDAVSIHSIKKEAYSRHTGEDKLSNYTLYDHFLNSYGDPNSAKFNRARDRFIESLAAYSIISYLLQIKDRHNGNILVDGEGRLIHIDFGFMLGISPGGVGFEAAPFKMPQEYIDILGGLESTKFGEFKALMRSGFRAVRKHAERIIMLVELMSKDSNLPCFTLGDLTATNLRDRFQLALSTSQCDEFVDKLIFSSAGSAFTRLYDTYQRLTEGVL